MSNMSSLDTKSLNLIVCNDCMQRFGRKFASCSFEEICNNFNLPCCTFSLTRWQFISRCFVISLSTCLEAMWSALWLSQYKTCGFEHVMCKSFRIYMRQINSDVVEPSASYFASNEDLDVFLLILCFLKNIRWTNEKIIPLCWVSWVNTSSPIYIWITYDL